MTCCSYGIQDSKKSRRNSLFPEVSRMVLSRNRAPVVAPPKLFRPSGHGKLLNLLGVRQLWVILWTENIFCPHIYGYICWLYHILLRKNRTTQPTQQGEMREKKFTLAERQRARNSLIFRCGCKHETPRCKRLKLK